MSGITLQGKKVLVTGAGGFIGSHLVERLVALGARVACFLRYNSRGLKGWIDEFPADVQSQLTIFWGDLKDPEAVRLAVKGQEIIFHLGALIAIPFSYITPRDFVDTNVLGTTNLLNAIREYGCERLIHTSTSEVYGTAQYVPIDEKHPLVGQSPYAASKIAADMLVQSYFRSFDLPAVTIRPFNAFGPRQSLRAIVPTIITQALAGKVVSLGSVHPTRDMNYVADTVEGFIAIASCEGIEGETINIGSGQEVAIRNLVERVGKILGKTLEIKTEEKRVRPEASEVARLAADNRKAKKLLGWQPKVSLDAGLNKTIEWFRAKRNLFATQVREYQV